MAINRVLVVEDSEADQFLCKVILENYNPEITVLQAHDGQEALEVLDREEQNPDVIFLDINMPRMNGYDFLDVFETKELSDAIVVIMLTSSDQERDKEKAMTYKSVKKYLEKPLSEGYLDEIQDLLK